MSEPQDNPAPREQDDNQYWAGWDDRLRPRTRKIPLVSRIVSAAFLAFGIVCTTFAFLNLVLGMGRAAATLAVISGAFYAAGWLMQSNWLGEPLNR